MEAGGSRAGRSVRGLAAIPWYARFLRDPLGCLIEAHRRFGEIGALGSPLPLGHRGRVFAFAFGPAWNQEVLGDPERFRTTAQGIAGPRDSAQRRVRHGLTRMQGERHRQQRQLVLPPFQKKAVDAACPTLVDVTGRLLDAWRPGRRLDAWLEMRALMLRLSSDILFQRKDAERSHALGELIGEWLSLHSRLGVVLFPVDLPGTPYRRLLRHAERMEREALAMVEEKRAGPQDAADPISRLIRALDAGAPWIEAKDLVGQATILFGASYETMSNAMSWTLFLLAQHPAWLGDLADELAAGLRGAPPDPESLARLPLLEAVLKESMRILPPVPYTIRSATAATRLGGLALRRSDRVVCSHYVTHHMGDLFPNPERFDPGRWSAIRPGPYEYLPFSAGPRLCIGYAFAMTTMKVALSMIVQRFRFALEPGARVDRAVSITMSPKHGLPMTLHPPGHRVAAAPVRGNVHEMVELAARA